MAVRIDLRETSELRRLALLLERVRDSWPGTHEAIDALAAVVMNIHRDAGEERPVEAARLRGVIDLLESVGTPPAGGTRAEEQLRRTVLTEVGETVSHLHTAPVRPGSNTIRAA